MPARRSRRARSDLTPDSVEAHSTYHASLFSHGHCTRLSSGEFIFDNLDELLQRLRAIQEPSIYEEGRRARDAEFSALLYVSLYKVLVCVLIQALLELSGIQSDCSRIAFKILG